MTFDKILERVERYYSQKVSAHGATAQGADWNSVESQRLRFYELLKVCERTRAFSLNDYGCGYGALADYMTEKGLVFQYCGFDISEIMIAAARELHAGANNLQFFTDQSLLNSADYTVASGVFNVKLETSNEEWLDYVLQTLDCMNEVSERGLAFNALTKYSDREFMRGDLFYADPLFLFDYCKQKYSRFVSLVHDYPLYEFTILVRKG